HEAHINHPSLHSFPTRRSSDLFFATRFVWPTWELYSVHTYLEKSLRVIKLYIIEVKYYYIKKGEPPTSYKLARKNAFIEVGNLRSEEHTSELQSRENLVCRLLL